MAIVTTKITHYMPTCKRCWGLRCIFFRDFSPAHSCIIGNIIGIVTSPPACSDVSETPRILVAQGGVGEGSVHLIKKETSPQPLVCLSRKAGDERGECIYSRVVVGFVGLVVLVVFFIPSG